MKFFNRLSCNASNSAETGISKFSVSASPSPHRIGTLSGIGTSFPLQIFDLRDSRNRAGSERIGVRSETHHPNNEPRENPLLFFGLFSVCAGLIIGRPPVRVREGPPFFPLKSIAYLDPPILWIGPPDCVILGPESDNSAPDVSNQEVFRDGSTHKN